MGEISEALEKALVVAFSRFLRDNPFFQKYMWQIAACVIGLPILWLAIVELRKLLLLLKRVLLRVSIEVPTGLRIPLVMSVLALTVAIFADIQYDFYVLLRVLVFVTCIACAAALRKDQLSTAWFWVMVAIAMIYNPLLPLHLERGTWEWINIATIPVFCLLCFLIKRPRETT